MQTNKYNKCTTLRILTRDISAERRLRAAIFASRGRHWPPPAERDGDYDPVAVLPAGQLKELPEFGTNVPRPGEPHQKRGGRRRRQTRHHAIISFSNLKRGHRGWGGHVVTVYEEAVLNECNLCGTRPKVQGPAHSVRLCHSNATTVRTRRPWTSVAPPSPM